MSLSLVQSEVHPVKREFFCPAVDLLNVFYCWGFLCIIAGSLPYSVKHREVTAAVIWCNVNKTELKRPRL